MKYTTFDTIINIIEKKENVAFVKNEQERIIFETDGSYYLLNFVSPEEKAKNFYVCCDDFSLSLEEYIDATDEEICNKIENDEYVPYSVDYSKDLWEANFKRYANGYLNALYKYEDAKKEKAEQECNYAILEKTKARDEIYDKLVSLRQKGVSYNIINDYITMRYYLCDEIVALREQRDNILANAEQRTIDIYETFNRTIGESQIEM